MRFIHVRLAEKWLKITGMKKEKQYFPRNKTVKEERRNEEKNSYGTDGYYHGIYSGGSCMGDKG